MWSIPLSRQPELMDDPALPAAEHVHALRALARINAFSFTATTAPGGIAAAPGTLTCGGGAGSAGSGGCG